MNASLRENIAQRLAVFKGAWMVHATVRWKWIEIVVISSILPLAGALLNTEDPFFLQASFPWIWFGPLLVALRYGIAPALASGATLALLWLGLSANGSISGEFPLHFMLGGALMSLIAGQFSSVWSTQLRRSDLLSRHASERFEQLSRAYFMIRHSHDRLEQNLISRPVTLRQAMMELRRQLDEKGGTINRILATELMAILTHYCSLSSAALYEVNNGRINPEALAQCGQGAPYLADDLLLSSALESGTTAYQAANRLTAEQSSSYLVAAPVRTSSGTVLGVLLVTDMPFMSLNRETLQIVGVLLAYAADHIEAAGIARKLIMIYPDCPTSFGAELVKMVHLKQDLDIASTLVVVDIKPGMQLNELCQSLESQQRGLDQSWRRDLGWGVQFVTLMPFSGPAAIEGYQARLNGVLGRQFKISLNDGYISLKYAMVSGDEPLMQLAHLLAEES